MHNGSEREADPWQRARICGCGLVSGSASRRRAVRTRMEHFAARQIPSRKLKRQNIVLVLPRSQTTPSSAMQMLMSCRNFCALSGPQGLVTMPQVPKPMRTIPMRGRASLNQNWDSGTSISASAPASANASSASVLPSANRSSCQCSSYDVMQSPTCEKQNVASGTQKQARIRSGRCAQSCHASLSSPMFAFACWSASCCCRAWRRRATSPYRPPCLASSDADTARHVRCGRRSCHCARTHVGRKTC